MVPLLYKMNPMKGKSSDYVKPKSVDQERKGDKLCVQRKVMGMRGNGKGWGNWKAAEIPWQSFST